MEEEEEMGVGSEGGGREMCWRRRTWVAEKEDVRGAVMLEERKVEWKTSFSLTQEFFHLGCSERRAL